MNNLKSGRTLISNAQQIIERDMQGAWRNGNYNMVIRRAQEAVELSLKGVLRILGIEYPKVHDVGRIFAEAVNKKLKDVSEAEIYKIVYISSHLAEDRSPSFYGEEEFGEEEAEEALHDAQFVFQKVSEMMARFGL